MRTKSYILLAVFVFLTVFDGITQLLPIQFDTLTRSQEIILNAGGEYSGTSLSNEMYSKFMFGGVITQKMKDAALEDHHSLNRFGTSWTGSIEYRNYNVHMFKRRDWGFLVKGGYHLFGGVLYPRQAFGLAMYGNERYLGDTIDLSGMHFNMMSFQKVGFGMIDIKSKSNVSLNVYNVDNYIQGQLGETKIIQPSDGSSIEMLLEGDMRVKQNQKFNQGIGFGIDVDFKFPFSYGKGKTAFVQLLAQNLGFAQMLEKQRTYMIDTVINYSGLEFDEIFGENAVLWESANILDTLNVHWSENQRTVLLPGYFQLGKIVNSMSNQRLQAFYGIRFYPRLIYVPYLYGGVHFRARKGLFFGANASYGGFTGFRGGLYASVRFNKVHIGLSTEDIIGAISKSGRGQAFYLRLRCVF